MNEFTKEELENILNGNIEIYPHTFENLRNKIESLIDSYCEHEWGEDPNNGNGWICVKCAEKYQ